MNGNWMDGLRQRWMTLYADGNFSKSKILPKCDIVDTKSTLLCNLTPMALENDHFLPCREGLYREHSTWSSGLAYYDFNANANYKWMHSQVVKCIGPLKAFPISSWFETSLGLIFLN